MFLHPLFHSQVLQFEVTMVNNALCFLLNCIPLDLATIFYENRAVTS